MELNIQSLKESMDFLNDLYENVTTAIFLADGEARIRHFNDAFHALSHCLGSEAIDVPTKYEVYRGIEYVLVLVDDVTAIEESRLGLAEWNRALARRNQRLEELLRIEAVELMDKARELQRISFEKENLIQEVHHRVGNNLQVISSLLNLSQPDDEEEKEEAAFRNRGNAVIEVYRHSVYESGTALVHVQGLIRAIVVNSSAWDCAWRVSSRAFRSRGSCEWPFKSADIFRQPGGKGTTACGDPYSPTHEHLRTGENCRFCSPACFPGQRWNIDRANRNGRAVPYERYLGAVPGFVHRFLKSCRVRLFLF